MIFISINETSNHVRFTKDDYGFLVSLFDGNFIFPETKRLHLLVSSGLILFTGFSFSGKAFKVSVNGESVSLRLRIFLKLYNEKSFGDGYLPVYTAPSVSVIFCYIVGGKDNRKNSLHWGFKFYFLKFVEHIM